MGSLRWALAGLSCVLLAGCGGPSSTSTSRAASRPPLIVPVLDTTSFPCPLTQVSTVDIEQCGQRKIATLNRQINARAKAIFARLRFSDEITHRFNHAFPADYGRRMFIAGERAWLRYRDAYCRSEGNIAEGGTAAGIHTVYCEVSVTAQHVKDLTAFDKALQQH